MAKLEAMRNRLEGLDIQLVGLNEMEKEVPLVEEDGNSPLENAEKKALCYYRAFGMPVFSCDTGLYFVDLPEELQPGIHVRSPLGKVLGDEEMTEYYGNLARQYGDYKAVYRNAICFVYDSEHVYRAMAPDMESKPFFITALPHPKPAKEGFPIDRISKDLETGKYFYDLPESFVNQIAVEDGFRRFFEEISTSHHLW